MTLLFDTNVVLDVLLAREPHFLNSARLMSRVERSEVGGLLGATSVTTLHYLLGKALGVRAARRHIEELLLIFVVAGVGSEVIHGALRLPFDDFEDAVLHESALRAGAHAIVTRDATGFRKGSLRAMSPEEALAIIDALDQDRT